ncbi:hypothetical protein PVK06_048021 [Gossypium arboreum]|uniref:Uncharacterized protein n=1 Tax=Gossypium arboreum TaxID=29729 RepID=A0ABR0MET7_GOSAR|nr:hypothetical protein PVK06_048021 [Gossypium arboreum]
MPLKTRALGAFFGKTPLKTRALGALFGKTPLKTRALGALLLRSNSLWKEGISCRTSSNILCTVFFVDVNLFKANKERAAGIAKSNNDIVGHVNNGSSTSTIDGLANEDANLMIKLKFLTYKLRTFLIRNGLSILFKDGPVAYRAYYLRDVFSSIQSETIMQKSCRVSLLETV